jgi:hypothetical protein
MTAVIGKSKRKTSNLQITWGRIYATIAGIAGIAATVYYITHPHG